VQHSAVVNAVVAVLLVIFAAVWAVTSYLNVRDRWDERPIDDEGTLPFSLRPRITLRAWIGGACGFGAFLCVLFLLGKLPF
jgi:TRAP-type C4-dicarboxylate transport system permease small subunit